MKIATWNVNSLNVRLPRLLAWLQAHQPDVLCLQELKMENAKFPHAELSALGYHALVNGQKTYNGVAILSKHELVEPHLDIPSFDDPQKRAVAATVNGVRIIGLYVVNGQAVDSEKYPYKLAWLAACTAWLRAERAKHSKLLVCGDFNIAPEDRDVHDPAAWAGQVLCTNAERAYFRQWLDLGLVDAYRAFDQPEKSFSWWDYRMLAFPKNQGLRIDHILISHELRQGLRECVIDRQERKGEKPSDHAPVVCEIETGA